MNQFELKSTCIHLIEKLKISMGESNLLKLSIDIKLPRLFNGEPEYLTKPIETICVFLSQLTINGVINVDIQKWQEQNDQITLLVNVNAINVLRLNNEKLKEVELKLRSICLELRDKCLDFNHSFETSQLSSSFKLNLITVHKTKAQEKALPFEMKRILIAEDNEVNAMVFSSFLDEWGCITDVVPNGLEAVTYTKDNLPDLILMDIYMPVLNGIDATKEIRKFNPTVPIIALTASSLDTDFKSAWAAGINDLLLKPVSSSNLFQVLSKYL